jgi:hypothetical protein
MINRAKSHIAKLIAAAGWEPLLGQLDYYRFPSMKAAWGGPFNGQSGRRHIFEELISSVPFSAIVETGTFRGTTTELFAATGLPVHTIEGSARNYGFARMRFRRQSNVQVIHGDSRRQLASLLKKELSSLLEAPLFIYLDAHWSDDLPLADELGIIFASCHSAIVMIDDFAVPDDEAYAFDDYGAGKALVETYVAPAVQKFNLVAFYPTITGREENGMKRGSVVLAKRATADKFLRKVTSLRSRLAPHNIAGE